MGLIVLEHIVGCYIWKVSPALLAGSMNLFLGKGTEAEFRISSDGWFETLICKVLLANYSAVTSVT
jgi:hypothetical protein